MATVRDLVHQSAMLAGMRASGEVLDATTAEDLLVILNQLIESWNIMSLLIYQIDRLIFPMVASKQAYSVGPGGDFAMVRPVALHDVSWRDEGANPPLELPLEELTDQSYGGIRVRETPSSIPSAFYYDAGYPLAELWLYPKPTATKQLVLYPWHPWDVGNTLDTVLNMPPGYARMLVHNLAVEYGQQPGARLNPATIQIAQESKYWLEVLNAEVPTLGNDYPRSQQRGRFNFYQVDC